MQWEALLPNTLRPTERTVEDTPNPPREHDREESRRWGEGDLLRQLRAIRTGESMRSEAEIRVDELPTDEEIARRIEAHPCMSCKWNIKLDCTVPNESLCPAERLNTSEGESKPDGSGG